MGQTQVMTIIMDDGVPDGTLKIDLTTWDCAMYRIERSKLQNYVNDSVLKTCGIYFLIGKEKGKPAVYVGQANSRNNGKGVLGRVMEHDKSAESYWDEALLVYSCSNALYATELNYLERNFWDKIQKSSYTVINASKPALGNCSAITQVTMDRFIEGVEKMVGILRYTFLEPEKANSKTPNVIKPSKSKTTGKQFYIKRTSKLTGRNVDAVCEIRNSKYVVLKGSLIAITPRSTKEPKKCGHDKYDAVIDSTGRLTQDVIFDKVSGASAFVLYGTSNGNVDWKDENGQPIRDFIP